MQENETAFLLRMLNTSFPDGWKDEGQKILPLDMVFIMISSHLLSQGMFLAYLPSAKSWVTYSTEKGKVL